VRLVAAGGGGVHEWGGLWGVGCSFGSVYLLRSVPRTFTDVLPGPAAAYACGAGADRPFRHSGLSSACVGVGSDSFPPSRGSVRFVAVWVDRDLLPGRSVVFRVGSFAFFWGVRPFGLVRGRRGPVVGDLCVPVQASWSRIFFFSPALPGFCPAAAGAHPPCLASASKTVSSGRWSTSGGPRPRPGPRLART